jgi:hypothetical protein
MAEENVYPDMSTPIHEVKEYVDMSNGNQITSMTPMKFLGGEAVFGRPRFRGLKMMEKVDSEGRKMTGRFPFLFPEKATLEECWNDFENIAAEQLKKAEEDEKARAAAGQSEV